DLLKSQGATIVEIEYLKDIGSAASSELEVLLYEFKAGVNDYLASSNAKVKTLADVIKFNQENESKAMPFFKQGTLERANAAGPLSDKKYLDAVNKSHIYCRNILDNLFKDHQLDAICGLTMGTACSIDEIYGDHYDEYFLTMPAAVSGYPHITVPCGMTFQLPIGFSFFGAAYDEPKMLAMAYAFEQASKKREKPQFRPHFS
ncbi:MAG: amidase, partial [Flavobacterium sp.]